MERSTHPLARKSQKWIADSFIELMKTKEYDRITITEICKKAQVDRRTFYRNFSSKEDVLDYYSDILTTEYFSVLLQVTDTTIYHAIKAYFEFWTPYIDLLNAMRKGGIFEIILRKIDEEFPSLYQSINRNKPDTWRYGMSYTNGGLWNVLNAWLEHGCQETPDEMGRIMESNITRYQDYWHPFR